MSGAVTTILNHGNDSHEFNSLGFTTINETTMAKHPAPKLNKAATPAFV